MSKNKYIDEFHNGDEELTIVDLDANDEEVREESETVSDDGVETESEAELDSKDSEDVDGPEKSEVDEDDLLESEEDEEDFDEYDDEEDYDEEPVEEEEYEEDDSNDEASYEDEESDDMGDDEDDTKKSGIGKKILIVLLSIVGVVAAIYLAGIAFFFFNFMPGTHINGTDCSYKSTGKVKGMLEDQVDSYVLTLKERNDVTETIQGTDVDLKFVSADSVSELARMMNPLLWPVKIYEFYRFGDTTSHEIHAEVSFDESKLDTAMKSLKCMDKESMIPPKDSYPALDGALYKPHPEEPGTTIDEPAFKKALAEAITGTYDVLDMDAAECYINPKLTVDSQEVKDECEKFNKYVGLTITYHFGDETEVLDGSVTGTWMTFNEDKVPEINQDAIKAWVADFAARHDTAGATRTFTAANGAQAQVTGGTYGWRIDQQAEIDQINAMFNSLESQDREPIYSQTAASHGATDWGNTYIEVSIANQHVWYVQDGQVVFEADVVTGLPTAKRATTKGVWTILEKKQGKVLRGEKLPDGSYEYETPVSYWLRVTYTGIGFHDASWQPWFGGDRYTYAGSHGCINMSYSTVQQLYGMVAVGTPVIIY